MIKQNVTFTCRIDGTEETEQRTATMGYCYATEIVYTDLAGEDIQNFMQEVFNASSTEATLMPNPKKAIYAILACLLAYYKSKGEESPVKDTDLMNEITPQELGIAIGTIIGLRAQFYYLPENEQKAAEREQAKKGKGKKAKN